jgi:acetoin utilization deacetylase AcuC-like enzyme
MSEWQVSTEEYAVLLTLLRDFAERHCAGRMLVTLEGGYDPMALEDCVLAMLKVLA